MKIVIPDDIPPSIFAGQPALDDLRALGEVTLYTDAPSSREVLVERARGSEIMLNVRSRTVIDGAVLESLPDLLMVTVFGTGTDNIDLAMADKLGIVVTNAAGANARSVAEHTLGLMLAVVRNIPAYDRDVRAGLWEHRPAIELEGKMLGVVGLGAIGRNVARIGGALGMHVLAWSIHQDPERAASAGAKAVDFETLLRESDIVSLNVALSDRTRGFIAARELALMRPGSVLVNTARGGLVDEAALAAALESGRLRGAGLDVFATEPLPIDSPLRNMDNVVLTPHIAWATTEARRRTLAAPAHNIQAYLHGRPVNVVNPASLRHPRQVNASAAR